MSHGPMTVLEAWKVLNLLVAHGHGNLPMYTEYDFVTGMKPREKQPHDDGCLGQLDDGTPIVYVETD